jgi:hypothetical protein
MGVSKKKQEDKSVVRVNASFTILPDLLEAARDKCWQEKTTFSRKVEELIKEWVDKGKANT